MNIHTGDKLMPYTGDRPHDFILMVFIMANAGDKLMTIHAGVKLMTIHTGDKLMVYIATIHTSDKLMTIITGDEPHDHYY